MTPAPQKNDILVRQAICNVMHARSDIELVILFGSLALGSETPESDIDLAFDAGHRLTADEKTDLIRAIAESTGRAVDLIDLRSVGEPLLGQILKHGSRILGSDEHYARLLYRHLVEQADFLPYRDRILEQRRREWIGK